MDGGPPDDIDLDAYVTRPAAATRLVADEGRIDLGNRRLTVMHVPGDSPGGIVLFEEASEVLITGDMLHNGARGIGRYVSPHSDAEVVLSAFAVSGSSRPIWCCRVISPPSMATALSRLLRNTNPSTNDERVTTPLPLTWTHSARLEIVKPRWRAPRWARSFPLRIIGSGEALNDRPDRRHQLLQAAVSVGN